jgi:hypothetical protein
VEYTRKGAFERMLVCANGQCPSYGDDTPDLDPGDIRCLVCGTTKNHWTRVPFKDLRPNLQQSLRDHELVKI